MAKAQAATQAKATKAKGKAAKEQAPAETSENMVTLVDLQNEFGYAPHYIRKVLRAAQEVGDFQHEKRARYQWAPDDENLANARRIMAEHVESVNRAAAERKAAAEAKAAEDDDEDEDEEFEDDEEEFEDED